MPEAPGILITNYPELLFEDYVNIILGIVDTNTEELRKKHPKKDLMIKKQLFIYLLREVYSEHNLAIKKCRFSLGQIQKVLELKSHASVISNYKQAANQTLISKSYDQEIVGIKNKTNQVLESAYERIINNKNEKSYERVN